MSSKVIQRIPRYILSMPAPAANPVPISWYRSPLSSQDFKSLHRRSDARAWFQTLGYLGLILLTGGGVLYGAGRWPVAVVIGLVFLYGTVCSFLINAVHELGHGTVFQTKALNAFFVRLFSFLGWTNFETFGTSHARHHRYTLHAPDDLEVVLPMKVILRNLVLYGIVNLSGLKWAIAGTIRIARGKFAGEWEAMLFPEGSAERRAGVNWARTMLVGHGLIVLAALYFHLWMLPVLTLFAATSCGSWLHNLCNNTQHIGLQDDVSDFRLCCRTFTINPIAQFLYWHMNFHIEHHMYAAVPCYNLARLHRLIEHDLPPCPHGLVATWKEIAAILKKQEEEPGYEYVAPLPGMVKSPAMAVAEPA